MAHKDMMESNTVTHVMLRHNFLLCDAEISSLHSPYLFRFGYVFVCMHVAMSFSYAKLSSMRGSQTQTAWNNGSSSETRYLH